jgi:uncharacterized protein
LKVAKIVSEVWAYVDSSALAKRYLEEAGRREVLRLLRRYDVVTSAVVTVELRSALRRRVAEGALGVDAVPEILNRVAAEREFWALMDVSSEVLSAAEALVAAHPLRILDAIHVASARLFRSRVTTPEFIFVSADERQTAAAVAVGLTAKLIHS